MNKNYEKFLRAADLPTRAEHRAKAVLTQANPETKAEADEVIDFIDGLGATPPPPVPRAEKKVDVTVGPDLVDIGDTVNYVQPHSKKIVRVKVVYVHPDLEGRLLTLEVPGEKNEKDGSKVQTLAKVEASHRPKESLAGHTWHHALIALLLLLSLTVRANLPTYHTFSGAGNSTYPATVFLPGDPNSQIRLVSLFFSTDVSTSTLQFSSGTTAYSIGYTNAATSTTTNIINSTNGLAAGSQVILQHGYGAGGVCYSNSVAVVGNTGTGTMTLSGVTITNALTTWGANGQGPAGTAATNVSFIVIPAGGWGVLPNISDEVYLMGPVSSLYLGLATTNAINGDDIFSGNYGRPVEVQLVGANSTNRLSSVGSHYDSASQ